MRTIPFLYLFLFLIAFKLKAQQYNFKNIGTEQGLPSSEVYKLLQDKQGYIWGATDAGVFKYNGTHFTVFTTKDGLPDNTIFNLFEDDKDRIWVCGYNNRVAYFKKDSLYAIAASSGIEDILKKGGGRIIYDIYKDSKDVLWLGSGLNLIKVLPENNYKNYSEIKNFSDSALSVLIEPDKGRVISSKFYKAFPNYEVIKEGNINSFFLELKTQKFHQFIKISKDKSFGMIPSHEHIALSDGRILLSYYNDLYIINTDGTVEKKTLQSNIVNFNEDSNKSLWVCLSRGGLLQFKDLDINKEPNHYLEGLTPTCVLQDNEEGIWVSTTENGLYYTASLAVECLTQPQGIDGKMIEVANLNNHIFAMDKLNTVFMDDGKGYMKKIALFEKPFVSDNYKLCVRNNVLYALGSVSGWSTDNFKTLHPFTNEMGFSITVVDIAFESDTVFYLLTHSHLLRYAKDRITNTYDLPVRGKCLLRNDDGSIYIGTLTGLYLFKSGSFTFLKDENEWLAGRINYLMRDANNITWVCTKGQGVLFKKNVQWHHIAEITGLASNITQKIIEGNLKNEYWVATRAGVSRLLFTKMGYDIKNYTTSNALPSNEISKIALRGDELWVATRKGLAKVDLKKNWFNSVAPVIRLRKLFVNETARRFDASYTFTYDENNLKLEIDGLTFKDIGKVKLKYKLQGYNNEIKTGDINQITFENLQAGDYKFTAWAVNANGIESAEPITFTFNIEKPFWLRWWFIVMQIVFGVLAVWLIIRWRLRVIQKKEEEKSAFNKQLAEYQMMALRAQMNPHFIFNAINGIQKFVLQKDSLEAYSYLTKFSHLIRQVLNNAHDKSISLKRELETLELYVEMEQLRFEQKFDFEISLQENLNTETITVPGMLIQPFVENAIWHGLMPLEGKIKGKIHVSIVAEGNGFCVYIEDNGIGREASEKIAKNIEHKSLGMKLTQQRLELISKNVSIFADSEKIVVTDLKDENGIPIGTRVKLLVQLRDY